MTDKIELRVAFGKNPRVRLYVASAERREELASLVALVKSAEGVDYEWAVKTLEKAAAASPEQFENYRKVIGELARGDSERKAKPPPRSGETFGKLAERWTTNELSRDWPDYVKTKRSVEHDVSRFEVLNKTIGSVPIATFALADAERAMRSLDKSLSSATRRHYAQLISKVLKLAVYPCKLIAHSPLPIGFLPKVKDKKAKSYLYPSEDAALLACKKVPLARRMLFGFLAREGLRCGEATGLRWRDIDLKHGTVNLDENKTDDPRSWVLSPGVKEALSKFKRTNAADDALVFPNADNRLADTFRGDLGAAEVKRRELFEDTDARRPIRVHDLRATFVTLALASGRSEAWITDRTGHKSSQMIYRYKRQARRAAELKLGELVPLDEAIPEFNARPKAPSGGAQPGQKSGQKAPSRAPSRPLRARSRSKTSGFLRYGVRSRTLRPLLKSLSSNGIPVRVREGPPLRIHCHLESDATERGIFRDRSSSRSTPARFRWPRRRFANLSGE
jgi:integrase